MDNCLRKKVLLFLKVLLGVFSYKKRREAFNKYLYHMNLQTNSLNAAGSSRGRPAMSRACW